MRALAAFARLSRVLFLYGGFAGVALGAAIAASRGQALDVATYVWVQCMVTAFQLMVHYANDYFDRDGDRGRARTAWSGGSGVLADGALPPRAGLIAAGVMAIVGIAVILHFASAGNVTVALVGCVMGSLSWMYSAPPVRLAARGLGEIDASFVVAVLVPSASYAAFAGALDAALVPALAATATAMVAMMLCVEIPDAGSDRLSGKRTLVVRLGIANALNVLMLVVSLALALTIGDLIALRSIGSFAGVVAVAAGLLLLRQARTDPRPASLALRGVALYGTTATALAVAYATAARG